MTQHGKTLVSILYKHDLDLENMRISFKIGQYFYETFPGLYFTWYASLDVINVFFQIP